MQIAKSVLRSTLAVLLVAGTASAWGTAEEASSRKGFAQPEERPVTAELITEHASIQPGGATRVGVHFDLAEGWHIYAKEPGDAGLPTQIAWSGAAGTTFGELQWPAPQAFVDPGDIRTFGYNGTTVLSSTVTIGMTAATSTPIHAKVSWLACKEVCIPGKTDLELLLPVSSKPQVPSTHSEFFAHTNG